MISASSTVAVDNDETTATIGSAAQATVGESLDDSVTRPFGESDGR
jgi:hypothetical protein